MKNESGKIIYIGKSSNLKTRVRSYFLAWAKLNFAKKKMIQWVKEIDFIETKNDIEALLLETNLIKEQQPKYNVLMKDGKNLSYIKITDGSLPCLVRTRIRNQKWEYFWPYSQYFDVYKYLRFLRKIFQLGNHEKIEKFGPPCMDTYLWICPGHCTWDAEKIETYKKNIESVRLFLSGKKQHVLDDLTQKMFHASQKRNFEEAARYKECISQIQAAGHEQIVRDSIQGEAIILVSLEKYEHIFLGCVEIKNSLVTWVWEFQLENPLDEPRKSILEQSIIQYLEIHSPKNIYTDIDISCLPDVQKYISERHISVNIPQKGEKMRILEFAHTNLLNFAYKKEMSGIHHATLSKKTMLSLLQKFWYKAPEGKKTHIIFECFDISHSHGEHTVGSKSVIVNGKPETKYYKKYRIKTLPSQAIDDFASIEEVLKRRAQGALRWEDPWPHLIVIDWWKWQLSHAINAISQIVWNKKIPVPLISLAKKKEEVFIPNSSEPIRLEYGSSELMLLQKIRDEAHRFAINYNRSSREKSYTKTLLDELPWIGPAARKKIFSRISKIEEMQDWNYEKGCREFGGKIATILSDHGLIGERMMKEKM